MKDLIFRKIKCQRKAQYSPNLRSFALTLQFYSSRAYNYVRRTWCNLLPHPSTIRNWYTVVDGKPGFTKEAFKALSIRCEKGDVFVNLVIDEMSIREQIIFDQNRFYGGVDVGVEMEHDSDNISEAKNALVFMAVAINSGWKVPLGYFLIRNLNGSERANLLEKCLDLLHEAKANCLSITFDGAPVNMKMCTSLGANFTYGENFKPWFFNPNTGEKVFVFWDAAHMIKLVRNTLGDKQVLQDSSGKINWNYLKDLEKLQSTEGLHAATKLSKKHINYNDNRMNVKLAVQTLSESVYNALRFVQELHFPQFEGSVPTANFCFIFNNIFDILNCRYRFSKKKQI